MVKKKDFVYKKYFYLFILFLMFILFCFFSFICIIVKIVLYEKGALAVIFKEFVKYYNN